MIELTDQGGFSVRQGTTDAMAVMALANDEYRIADRDLHGWAIDVEMPAVSIDGLLSTYAIEDVALLKIDCEGCEWAFLDTPAVSRIEVIVGEYHGGYPGKPGFQEDPQAKLRELLGDTHEVTIWDPAEKVVGLFEAVRRG